MPTEVFKTDIGSISRTEIDRNIQRLNNKSATTGLSEDDERLLKNLKTVQRNSFVRLPKTCKDGTLTEPPERIFVN